MKPSTTTPTPRRRRSVSKKTPSMKKSKRDEDHLKALVRYVNIIVKCDHATLHEMRDNHVFSLALCRLRGIAPKTEPLDKVVLTLESLLKLKSNSIYRPMDDPLDENNLADVIQMMLGYAVEGSEKERCVSEIMQMDQDIQQYLMIEVETALKRVAMINSAPPSPSPFKSSPLPTSPQTGGKTVSTTQRKSKVKKLLRENQALHAENEQLISDNTNLQKQLEKVQQNSREHMLRNETEFDSQIQIMTQKLEEKEVEFSALQQMIDNLQRENKVVTTLRDQIEILTAQVADSAKKDSTIQRLKEKLLNSTDLSKQVDELTAANERLLAKAMESQEAISELSKVKAEVERCKEAYTESQLSLNETKLALKKKTQQLEQLESEVVNLQHAESVMTQENLALQMSSADDDEKEELPPQQLGISELNPKVREDLERLTKENISLKSQLDGQSQENLESLVFENDSLKRVNEKLGDDVFTLTNALNDEKNNVTTLVEKVAGLEAQIAELDTELQDTLEKKEKLLSEIMDLTSEHERTQEYLGQVELDLTTKDAHCVTAEKQLTDLRHRFDRVCKDKEELLQCCARNISDIALCSASSKISKIVWEKKFVRLENIMQTQMETRISELETLNAGLQKECELRENEHVVQINEMTGRLLDAQENLEKQKVSYTYVKRSAEKLQLEVNFLVSQNGQFRRQLKALQVQKMSSAEASAATGEEQQELLSEIQRLVSENEKLQKLAHTSGGSSSFSGVGNKVGMSEMIQTYKDHIEKLEREAQVLSLAKTSELMSRRDIQSKYKKLQNKLDSKEAENTSLKLQLERLKTTQFIQDKENRVRNESSTMKKTAKMNFYGQNKLDDNNKEQQCETQ